MTGLKDDFQPSQIVYWVNSVWSLRPSACKKFNVTLVHKTNQFLPNIAKVLDKIIANQLSAYLK